VRYVVPRLTDYVRLVMRGRRTCTDHEGTQT
jgi:hypothetical protein